MGVSISTNGNNFINRNLGAQSEISDRFLKWIEGDGASYIDTGFTGYRINSSDVAGTIPANLPKFVIDFEKESGSFDVPYTIIYGNGNNQSTFSFISPSNIMKMFGKGAKADNTLTQNRNKLEYGCVKSYFNDTQIADNTNMSNQYRLSAYNSNITLFKTIFSNAEAYSSKIRIYEFKYYEGETLKLHLKPYAKKSGEIGMFDVVSNTFFENKGTGTFIYEEL